MKKIVTLALAAVITGCAGGSYTTQITSNSSEETYSFAQEKPVVEMEPVMETAPPPVEVMEPIVTHTAAMPPVSKEVIVKDTVPVNGGVKIMPPTKKQMVEHRRFGYTIQVMALSHDKEIKKRAQVLPGSNPIWMNQKEVNGSPWYTILYGDFATKQQAKAAIASLPAKVRAYGPFVRSIDDIKNSAYPKMQKLN
ncbi:SPOR domain-containing protein [Vibrio sp. Of7-15]|uniref:SPOR domain-containing protein n=1 Tax=Vibrio sp. Of7-15 TaxID=2724879 RepID=UPI001EF2163F|nr:SPOR domain-containing protein [Vibrio sp. Of7-15]MCG7495718.1 SPOR domain-containing protein [Vibrio sp. Of7-15]